MSPRPNLTFAEYPAFEFTGLKCYTRGEVMLWNWCRQFLRDEQSWKLWIEEAWGEFLLSPAGLEISLVQAHTLDAQAPTRQYTFKQSEILIGRDPSNDVVIEGVAAGRRHAKIVVEEGRCFLEDLGSSLGTYCNQVRVPPAQRRPLAAGDQITVFPHVLTPSIRQLWARTADIGLFAAAPETTDWGAFRGAAARDCTVFVIRIHPVEAAVYLEINRTFLLELADRILRPAGFSGPPTTIGPTHNSFFEFLALSLIERANRDLSFPFRFELLSAGREPMASEAAGISARCSVSVLDLTGAVRLFAPYASLRSMREASSPAARETALPPFSWKFPVSLGSVTLTPRELAGLEPYDVVLYETALELLLPHRSDRGWRAAAADDGSAGTIETGNIRRLRIENYFERDSLSTESSTAGSPPNPNRTPAIDDLPVRLQVILAEKELTLREASGLAKGSIVELDRQKNALVSLAVNGKILGEGQLVEIEGRMGVKILSWRGA